MENVGTKQSLTFAPTLPTVSLARKPRKTHKGHCPIKRTVPFAFLAASDVLSLVLERYRRASMRSMWLRGRQKGCANAILANLNASRTYPA